MIVFGITGGIASYKVCSVVSYFAQKSEDVHVVMTDSAKKFVTPLTFATLSRNPVIDDDAEWTADGEINHILYSKADPLVIVPATANTIAKAANGIADNVLTSLATACEGRIMIFPAMNTKMYHHRQSQENINKLRKLSVERGKGFSSDEIKHGYKDYQIIGPDRGRLACGDYGLGTLVSTKTIIETIEDYL